MAITIARCPRVAPSAGRVRGHVRPVAVVRATPSKPLDSQIQEALQAADDTCGAKGVNSKECEVAWDQAEELLAHKSHMKVAEKESGDPLEQFCKGEPDADECRVHDN